ncbi:unnamed protein product [Prorocentrum cordatum]|uniref:Uncharacterized protein n=1 Tax=Prorocentrum cordatum TaxID=2364126 RepID=A0ABN9QQ81_9DINO|nr:unnamed protein product [Polarella glacialis]
MSALAAPAPRVFEDSIRASALMPTVHHMTSPQAYSRSPSRRALQSPQDGESENLRSCQDHFEVVISAEKMQRRAALADITSKIEGQQIMVEETSKRQAQLEVTVATLRAEIRQLAQWRDAGGDAEAAQRDQEQRQDLAELANSVQALHEEMASFRDQAQCQAALAEETSTKQIETVASVMELGQGLQEIAQTVVATEQKLRREIEEAAVTLEASAREEAANTSNQILEALQQTTVQLADSLATEREGRKEAFDALSERVDELCRSRHSPSALPQEVEFLRSLVDEVRGDVTRLELAAKAPEGGPAPSEDAARLAQVESQLQRLSEQSSAFEASMEEVRGDLMALKEVGDMLLTDLQERSAGADAAGGSQFATVDAATGATPADGSSCAQAMVTFCDVGGAFGPAAAQDGSEPGTPRMVQSMPRMQSSDAGQCTSKCLSDFAKVERERSVSPAPCRDTKSPRGPDPVRSSHTGSANNVPMVAPPRGTMSATSNHIAGQGQRMSGLGSVRCTSPAAAIRRRSPEVRSRASTSVDGCKMGGLQTKGSFALLQGSPPQSGPFGMRSAAGSFVTPVQAAMRVAGRPGASFVAAPPQPMAAPVQAAQVQLAGTQTAGSAVVRGTSNMAPMMQMQQSPHMPCR